MFSKLNYAFLYVAFNELCHTAGTMSIRMVRGKWNKDCSMSSYNHHFKAKDRHSCGTKKEVSSKTGWGNYSMQVITQVNRMFFTKNEIRISKSNQLNENSFFC